MSLVEGIESQAMDYEVVIYKRFSLVLNSFEPIF